MKLSVKYSALLLLPLLPFILRGGDFPYPLNSAYSDFTITHYPNMLYIRQSILDSAALPLWCGAILSGYPFFADPLSGLWYLPGLAALVFPLPLGINLVILAHLLWGGIGMFAFLRSRHISAPAALVGALLFEMMPKVFAHYSAGHVTLIYAVSWTPWLLLAQRRAFEKRLPGDRLLPGIVWGMIILADVRWAVYAGILWFFYAVRMAVHEISRRDQLSSAENRQAGVTAVGTAAGRLGDFSVQAMTGLFAAAPLLLPLLEYLQLSTRQWMTVGDRLLFSLPPVNMLGFLFPLTGVNIEWIAYPGALALLLLVISLGTKQLRRRNWFWMAVFFGSVFFSLGSYNGIGGWLAGLPGMSLLRVPPRALFLAGFALAVVSASAGEALLNSPAKLPVGRFRLLITAYSGLVILLAAGIGVLTGELHSGFLWGCAAVVIYSTLLLLLISGDKFIALPYAWTALVLMLVVELAAVGYLQVNYKPGAQVINEKSALVQFLAEQEGVFRVYSPSYSVPQQAAVRAGIELADGVDPLQLADYARYMALASGVPMNGYSVTLPPFESGTPAEDNRPYTPDTRSLGLLNVRYVASEYPLDNAGMALLEQVGGVYIYENPDALPRAWRQPAAAAPGEAAIPVAAAYPTPNRITAQVEGPGLFVLSEIDYPGWRLTVDGQAAQIEKVGGLLRGVELGEGEHALEFVFRPRSLTVGILLAACAWVLIAARLFARLREWRGTS